MISVDDEGNHLDKLEDMMVKTNFFRAAEEVSKACEVCSKGAKKIRLPQELIVSQTHQIICF